MNIKRIVGQILYKTLGTVLPPAHCRIKWLGDFAKWFRGRICGPLILEKCGKNVNIYKKAKISSKVQLGDGSDIGYEARIYGLIHWMFL